MYVYSADRFVPYPKYSLRVPTHLQRSSRCILLLLLIGPPDTRWGSLTPLQRCNRCTLQPRPAWDSKDHCTGFYLCLAKTSGYNQKNKYEIEYLSLLSAILGVMVIIVGSGHGNSSSKPGREWLHFVTIPPRPPRIRQLLRTISLLGRWSTSGSDRGIAHFFIATRNTIKGVGGKRTNEQNAWVNSSARGGVM